jgi:hypothetical protein
MVECSSANPLAAYWLIVNLVVPGPKTGKGGSTVISTIFGLVAGWAQHVAHNDTATMAPRPWNTFRIVPSLHYQGPQNAPESAKLFTFLLLT